MKKESTSMMMQNNKRLTIILAIAAGLLLVPLIAMQFTNQVTWSGSDFMVMGLLLLLTGLAIEFVLRRVRKMNHRIVFCLLTIAVFLLVWAELAVGVFGTPFAGS